MFGANVNIVAVIVCIVVAMALGFLWYSPALFANQWMSLIGKSKEQLGKPGPGYALTIVTSAVTGYVVGVFVALAGPKTPLNGALVGLTAGLGFVATSFASQYIFEGRPSKLYLINAGYQVVAIILMGLVHGLIP